jgi:hypothetical protein
VPALAKLNRETVPLHEQVRLASSCQNEVILPWTKDKIDDKVSRPTGPVYEEAPKCVPRPRRREPLRRRQRPVVPRARGGGLNLVPNGGRDSSTTSPAARRQPAAGAAPPLRPNVPCETQEQPDLRTKPAAAPSSASTRSGGVYETALPAAPQSPRVKTWLARSSRSRRGPEQDLKVSSKPVTKATSRCSHPPRQALKARR